MCLKDPNHNFHNIIREIGIDHSLPSLKEVLELPYNEAKKDKSLFMLYYLIIIILLMYQYPVNIECSLFHPKDEERSLLNFLI